MELNIPIIAPYLNSQSGPSYDSSLSPSGACVGLNVFVSKLGIGRSSEFLQISINMFSAYLKENSNKKELTILAIPPNFQGSTNYDPTTSPCGVCLGFEASAKDTLHHRTINRDNLLASVQRECKTCVIMWMVVNSSHDWNEVGSVMLDFNIVPGTLTLFPFRQEGGRQLDRLVLYTCKGN
jgi:hypothetical protein